MSLPITQKQAFTAVTWMKTNFNSKITEAVKGTPFTVDAICAIACQETAYFWLSFIGKKSVDEILARCVLDASGDFEGTQRSAFPRNTNVFRLKYSQAFTNMLINEANATRKWRGFGPQNWVYKGYGIFQYDLQFVVNNQSFFEQKKWYSIDVCLKNVMVELNSKWAKYKHTENAMWKTIKAYNGTGENATKYANNVMQYIAYSKQVNI